MKTLFFCLAALSTFLAPQAHGVYRLDVELKGLKSTTGSVQICLMNEEGQFLKSCFKSETYRFEAGKQGAVSFTDLSPGKYAIMAFHDSDDDGKLTCDGLFGMPSEPYAFSNNPSTLFGPPAHRKCVFEVKETTAVVLKF